MTEGGQRGGLDVVDRDVEPAIEEGEDLAACHERLGATRGGAVADVLADELGRPRLVGMGRGEDADGVGRDVRGDRNGSGEPLQIPDWTAQPLGDLLNTETRVVMQEGIAKLPEELRTVFVLRDIEELSNAEVAQILNLSVAAVKSRLHRARIFLRDRLNRYFADKMSRRDRAR